MTENIRIRLRKKLEDLGQKASIETVDSSKHSEYAIFGQLLDSERGPLSTTNPLKTKALDSVGQFGQSKQEDHESDNKNNGTETADRNTRVCARARVAYKTTVQTVQTVQNSNKDNENKDLILDSEGVSLSNHCPISDTAGGPEFERVFWSWLTEGAPDETNEARAWRQRYRAAIESLTGGHTPAAGRRRAWAVLQRAWHRQYGKKPDPNICAGCGEAIADRESIEIDGAFCHIEGEGDQAVGCIIEYGEGWRGAADEGLRALGLIKPGGLPVAYPQHPPNAKGTDQWT